MRARVRPPVLMPQPPNMRRATQGPTLASSSQQYSAKSWLVLGMAGTIRLCWQNANMARPKSASHELKRDEILDIAAQCFADRSYPAASMNDIAAAIGTSKARLYHYYSGKDAILFDLLDRYTQRLLAIIGQVEATAQRRSLDDRAALHELVRDFLQEYETSATRHVALLHATQFLPGATDASGAVPAVSQRDLILNRQRDVVSAVTRFLRRAYPQRVNAANQTAQTMMLFGMINWTFTWLRPGGAMSYAAFAEQVIGLLEHGLAAA